MPWLSFASFASVDYSMQKKYCSNRTERRRSRPRWSELERAERLVQKQVRQRSWAELISEKQVDAIQESYFFGRSTSISGIDTAWVMARSGCGFPFCKASASISMACPVFGGLKIVARNNPLRTHACPVFGKPSIPINGVAIQRSRSISLRIS